MKIRTLLAFASLVLFFCIIVTADALLPSAGWSLVTSLCLVLFAGASAATFLVPITRQNRKSDASTLALLGPGFALLVALQAWSAFAVVLSLCGLATIAWAMTLIAVSTVFAATAILAGASKLVDAAALKGAQPSDRARWVRDVEQLLAVCSNPEVKSKLALLLEQLKFSSDDVLGVASPHDSTIRQDLAALSRLMGQRDDANGASDAQANTIMQGISTLIEQREAHIKSQRQRA